MNCQNQPEILIGKHLSYPVKYFGIIAKTPHDVTLVAGLDKIEVPAHRLVMMAFSKYFAALLGPHFAEGTQSKVTLNDIDGETLKAIVDHCYSGRIEVNDDNADRIIAAASRMAFPDIEEIVGQYWSNKLSVENCLDMLALADKYSLQKLWKKTLKFCAVGFDQLPSPEKLNMDGKILLNLLKCEELKVTEKKVFTFVVAWVERDEEYRAKYVPDIIKIIRVKPAEFLYQTVSLFYRLAYRIHKYGCDELVNVEHGNRKNNDRIVDIKLNRSTSRFIHCINWTRYASEEQGFVIKMYNPVSNKWKHLKAWRIKRWNIIGAVFSSEKLFVFSNICKMDGKMKFLVLSYDSLNHQPTRYRLTKMAPRPHWANQPVSIGKYIYLFGGIKKALDTCDRYDTEQNRWEERRFSPINIQSTVAFNGKIYGHNSRSLFYYDIEANEWKKDAFNTGLCYGFLFNMFTLGQCLYINTRHLIHQYDPVENIWTLSGRTGSHHVASAIEHQGINYILNEDGSFGTENLNICDSLTLLNIIEDERFQHVDVLPFTRSLLYLK